MVHSLDSGYFRWLSYIRTQELSDGDRILNFNFKPNSVSVTQFLPILNSDDLMR